MTFYANAKINIGLDVVGKLPNGYHEVSMIMQEISLCDTIEIFPDISGKIDLKIENSDLSADRSNIAYRAAELFFEKSGIDGGCSIKLKKNIPVCAGLGGGSADAACVLKGLNSLYSFPFENEKLMEIGLSLGADVPFCIMGGCAHAGGIGEKLTRLNSALDYSVCLIKPDIDISTPLAYKAIDAIDIMHPDINMAISASEKGDISLFSKYTGNVFEYVCCPRHKEIDMIKDYLKSMGAVFTMMSGSGPTVFGLFEKEKDAENAFNSYKGSYQGGGVCNFVNSSL